MPIVCVSCNNRLLCLLPLPSCCLSLVFYAFIVAALRSGCGHYIFVLFLGVFSSPISALANWMYTILLHMMCRALNANSECRSQLCCTRLAGNTGRKNDAKIAICAPSRNFVRLYLRNEGMYRQSKKNS